MSDPVEKELLDHVASLSRPSLAKARAPSWREMCKSRARADLRQMLEAAAFESESAAARHLGVDRRFLADCEKGAREVPLWLVHSFPRQAQLAFVRALLEGLPDEQDDENRSKTERVA